MCSLEVGGRVSHTAGDPDIITNAEEGQRLERQQEARSVDPLVVGGTVHHPEGDAGALVEDAFGLQALILIVTVLLHALTEGGEVVGALLAQNVLTGRALVLSVEAARMN